MIQPPGYGLKRLVGIDMFSLISCHVAKKNLRIRTICFLFWIKCSMKKHSVDCIVYIRIMVYCKILALHCKKSKVIFKARGGVRTDAFDKILRNRQYDIQILYNTISYLRGRPKKHFYGTCPFHGRAGGVSTPAHV